MGFVCSFCTLLTYEMTPRVKEFIPTPNWTKAATSDVVISFVVIAVGRILYHWYPEPEVEAITSSAADKESELLLQDSEAGIKYM